MSLTLLDAWKRAQRSYLAKLVLQELITVDELLPMMPMVAKPGVGFSFSREKSLPSFGWIPDAGATVLESTGADETISVMNRQAVSDFYVPAMADAASDEFLNQSRKKFKAAGLELSRTIINGGNITGVAVEAFQSGAYVDTLVSASSYMDSYRDGLGTLRYTHTGTFLAFRAPGDAAYGPNVACATDGTYTLYGDNPSKWIKVTLDVSDATADAERVIRFTSSTNEFDGLKVLVTPGQTRTSSGASGDALSLGILDELIDSTLTGTNRVFVMNGKLQRKFKELLRAGGGVDMVQLASGVMVPSYAGIPIVRNENILSNETKSVSTLSSVYLLSLGEDDGVYLGALGGEKFDVEANPMKASLMGFRLDDLGPIQDGTKGNVRGGRLAWYGGLAMGSQRSCSRASEITTA